MTREQIEDKIGGISVYKGQSERMKNAFAVQLATAKYDSEKLLFAWKWFDSGWIAHIIESSRL
jgi:hypothetical protein